MQDEPSTFDLIGLAMALEKVVCVPKLYSDGSMKPIIINPFTEFGVDEFGKNTFRVYSHPSWIKEGFEDESIRKIFDLIMEFKGKFDRVKFNDAVAASVACKASVKANTRITFEEMEKIIENLFTCKFPYTCPHGRPTHIKYPKYELEKMFKRVNFSKVNNND